LPHTVHLAALAAPEKLPAVQSTHRSGLELVVSASYVPGLQGCFVSQNGWLASSWYLPVGQSSQLGEFNTAENVPMPHEMQLRFDVAVPSESMCLPAAHEAWSMQMVLLAWSWNCPSLHAVQAGAFSVSENVPTPHDTHLRFAIRVPSVSMRVPAAHVAWSMQ
jgi:hypothetical protein